MRNHDMNTELPYDEMTAARFRAEVAAVAQRQYEQFAALVTAERTLLKSEKYLQLASMHAANFGWSLVALIRWAEQTFGPEAGWKAAAMAQDVMTNGGNEFCEDIELPAPGQLALVSRPDRRTCAAPGDQEYDHAMCEDVVAEDADQASGATRPNSAEHITTITAAEDPTGCGLDASEWRCSCGAGSPHPIAPPTAERKMREHLATVTAPNSTGGAS